MERQSRRRGQPKTRKPSAQRECLQSALQYAVPTAAIDVSTAGLVAASPRWAAGDAPTASSQPSTPMTIADRTQQCTARRRPEVRVQGPVRRPWSYSVRWTSQAPAAVRLRVGCRPIVGRCAGTSAPGSGARRGRLGLRGAVPRALAARVPGRLPRRPRRRAAEDIAQEAFLAAVRNLDRFDRRRPFGPWLHRIVVNRAIDWSRAAPTPRRGRARDESPVEQREADVDGGHGRGAAAALARSTAP